MTHCRGIKLTRIFCALSRHRELACARKRIWTAPAPQVARRHADAHDRAGRRDIEEFLSIARPERV